MKVPKISHHNILAKSQNLIPQIDSETILFLGDSRVEWGVKPIRIKKTTNYKGNIINLAMPGSNGLDILNYLQKNSIYPRLIIIGYTPNYGRYKNHELDIQNYSYSNKRSSNIKYLLKQRSYTYDYSSILEYFKGNRPYFRKHFYDEMGGVVVQENGDYGARSSHQHRMYEGWAQDLKNIEHDQYLLTLSSYLKGFKGNSLIYGIYMPTSETLMKFESDFFDEKLIEHVFEGHFLNYSDYVTSIKKNTEHDSAYFYDSSHLTMEYSKVFTDSLSEYINGLLTHK